MFIKIEQVKDKSFDNMVKLYISTGLVRDKDYLNLTIKYILFQ